MTQPIEPIEALAAALARQDGYGVDDVPMIEGEELAWYRGEAVEVIRRLKRDGIEIKAAHSDISVAAKRARERERAGLTSATPERLAKAGLENVEVGQGTLIQRIVDAPLDRLRDRGEITDREFMAGEMYRNDHQAAQVDPGAPSVDWNVMGAGFGPRTPSMFQSQAVANARLRWRDIERAFPPRSLISVILKAALVSQSTLTEIGNLVMPSRDRKESIASGKAAFRMALAAAADHYRHYRL